ncbi:hypothetical protein BGW36DRAFT_274802, partial [Talaromyces proteolyticus]
SRIPSPASKYDVRPRTSFGKTRTLKDAFEATSPALTMESNEGGTIEPIAVGGRTPSPNGRHQRNLSLPSPLAEVHSPPPGELLETYRRINDADYLADLVSEDDLDNGVDSWSRRSSRERRKRESSGSSDRQQLQYERRDNDVGYKLGYLEDNTDDPLRGTLSTYKRDEERLKHATTSQSPIFSRAKGGTRAENLQRRELEVTEMHVQEQEHDDGPQPGLNVPRNWGNKSKSHRQWLSSVTKQNGDLSRDKPPRRVIEREITRDNSRSRSPQKRLWPKGSSERDISTGDAIPNTPIVVYRGGGSTDRTQLPRSDSRDLLRKLARTESPNQSNTPEPQKPANKPLPDKTPVVIGAWVDTPMTVRPTAGAIEENITKELDSPSKLGPNSTSTTVSTQHSSSEDHGKNVHIDSRNTAAGKGGSSTEPFKSNLKQENKLDSDSERQANPERIKPKLPKSALDTVLEDAKSNGNPLLLSDDTINSLQGLMDGADAKLSRFAELKDEDIKVDLTALESDINDLQTQNDAQALDKLNFKIQSIIHGIQDARTGLDGLEDVIVSDGVVLPHKDSKACKACGSTQNQHADGRIYLAIPIPRLWYRHPVSKRLRLTIVSWALVIFGCWYMTECIMCDNFCHPAVAEVCDGYCLQPDAPQFPFTLPTMVWRWSHLSVILSPIITISIAFFRLVAQLLGFWDGYIDD